MNEIDKLLEELGISARVFEPPPAEPTLSGEWADRERERLRQAQADMLERVIQPTVDDMIASGLLPESARASYPESARASYPDQPWGAASERMDAPRGGK